MFSQSAHFGPRPYARHKRQKNNQGIPFTRYPSFASLNDPTDDQNIESEALQPSTAIPSSSTEPPLAHSASNSTSSTQSTPVEESPTQKSHDSTEAETLTGNSTSSDSALNLDGDFATRRPQVVLPLSRVAADTSIMRQLDVKDVVSRPSSPGMDHVSNAFEATNSFVSGFQGQNLLPQSVDFSARPVQVPNSSSEVSDNVQRNAASNHSSYVPSDQSSTLNIMQAPSAGPAHSTPFAVPAGQETFTFEQPCPRYSYQEASFQESFPAHPTSGNTTQGFGALSIAPSPAVHATPGLTPAMTSTLSEQDLLASRSASSVSNTDSVPPYFGQEQHGHRFNMPTVEIPSFDANATTGIVRFPESTTNPAHCSYVAPVPRFAPSSPNALAQVSEADWHANYAGYQSKDETNEAQSTMVMPDQAFATSSCSVDNGGVAWTDYSVGDSYNQEKQPTTVDECDGTLGSTLIKAFGVGEVEAALRADLDWLDGPILDSSTSWRDTKSMEMNFQTALELFRLFGLFSVRALLEEMSAFESRVLPLWMKG